ncbi:MAG: hypothetical protein IPG23_12750 [Burkholderiales bacterium]|jgi:hypothetical protein|nr:hypothetical protein [Burkholderiales bacterium]
MLSGKTAGYIKNLMPFCPKCATTGDDNATVCTVCGAPLPLSPEIAAIGLPEPQPITKRKIIAIILGLLSMWLGGLLFQLTGGLLLLVGLSLACWLYMAKGKVSLFFAYICCAVFLVLAFVVFAVLGAAVNSR